MAVAGRRTERHAPWPTVSASGALPDSFDRRERSIPPHCCPKGQRGSAFLPHAAGGPAARPPATRLLRCVPSGPAIAVATARATADPCAAPWPRRCCVVRRRSPPGAGPAAAQPLRGDLRVRLRRLARNPEGAAGRRRPALFRRLQPGPAAELRGVRRRDAPGRHADLGRSGDRRPADPALLRGERRDRGPCRPAGRLRVAGADRRRLHPHRRRLGPGAQPSAPAADGARQAGLRARADRRGDGAKDPQRACLPGAVPRAGRAAGR